MGKIEPLIFKHLREEVPNPKQIEFFQAEARHIGYGGARGGGKSWAGRRKAVLLCMNYDNLKGLILRRTMPELRNNHIIPLRAELYGYANYNAEEKAFIFPNGSRLALGYCDNEGDLNQYQGQEVDFIIFEEATHFPEEWITFIRTSLRTTRTDFKPRVYYTTNPGGVGHNYIKRIFIDRNFRKNENPDDYVFIQASVYDNKVLMDANPEYIDMLKALPDAKRKAHLEGRWDVFEGQYFTEFNREIHVAEPFEIPKHWRRYFTMDYGLDMLAGYWIAVDEEGRAYVYREIYQSGLIISDAAKAINDLTEEEIYAYFAPPDLWNRRQDTGKSAADIFAENGVPLIKAKNDRVQGWLDLHEWLKPRMNMFGKKVPYLQIFSNCANLIRTIPSLIFDNKNPNDVAKEPHELTHAPDAIRYFVAGRPISADKPINDDETPLTFEEEVSDFVNFGI